MDPVYLQDNFHLDTTGATSETTSDGANGGGVNASLTDPSLPLLFAHKIVDQIVCAIAHVATTIKCWYYILNCILQIQLRDRVLLSLVNTANNLFSGTTRGL